MWVGRFVSAVIEGDALQVDDLEAAVRAVKAADHTIEVQAAESRARSLQGSLSRKEDTIRELRERMDQACR